MATVAPIEIERVPWSELGPQWIEIWGGAPEPEHIEITGQTGSGKTYFLATILQERARRFDDREILIATKPADETLKHLGWPVTDRFADVKAYRQVIFWPQTGKLGEARERSHEEQIYDLLTRLWVPRSNCVVAIDEMGYVENLSSRMRKMVGMYWREARSQGITVVIMKQRPLRILRDAHSETRWKVVYPPADRGDMRRFADLLGRQGDWESVLDSLGQWEFVLRHSARRKDVTVGQYVSWIDFPLRPIAAQRDQRKDERPPQYRKEKR